jgi:hypothetical protein
LTDVTVKVVIHEALVEGKPDAPKQLARFWRGPQITASMGVMPASVRLPASAEVFYLFL